MMAGWLVAGLPPFARTAVENLNGEYLLSATPHANRTQLRFPTRFHDYPRPVESFDVYSPPIRSLYSQVFWKALPPVPLPEDVVARYSGQGMAVVGFEVDQVRRTPSGDIPVPISVAYNHHFESTMVGGSASFRKATSSHRTAGHRRQDEIYVVDDRAAAADVPYVRPTLEAASLPTSQSFGGANGGEYRKSFHGYAPGYAQLIQSPRELQITPMQIDTWNRDEMNVSHPTKFVPGPMPRNSLAPHGAMYSGLLECPVTTRIRKLVDGGYVPLSRGSCQHPIQSAAECFAAAASTLAPAAPTAGHVVTDPRMPAGCLATVDAAGGVQADFNAARSSALCAADNSEVSGAMNSLVNMSLHLSTVSDRATITLSGPSSVWFAVGFNAHEMGDAPWTVVVDGNGNVTERKLADHNPGTLLLPSLTLESSHVAAGRRTVTLTRPLKGATPEYYSFDPTVVLVDVINAVGSGPQFAYHKARQPSAISLLPPAGGAAVCLCAAQPKPFGEATGTLAYVRNSQPEDEGSGTVAFDNHCDAAPRSDLLAQRNPACDVRTYAGGQTACHHMWALLDADQQIPWVKQPLIYHLKFRFWVQPYNASYHTDVKRTTWGIASPVEYDVPKCAEGIEGCARAADGSWVHTIRGTYSGGGKLVAAHFHCHAPTCLSMAMYKCAKDVAVCNATTGELLCEEKPIYGGSGKVDLPRFDEPGFILQPPCLWGDEAFGLEPPPDVTGLTLHSVKTANATFGHHGEMAWQQMYFV
mmetsp:Transcript_2949/g.6209  ORF Transcript_2949/g.6209 Transcript_2949/m.6209 type:complete len:755 (+) Transcript_2949:19-2283(+)